MEKMSSSELGALWKTYQMKTLIFRMLEYFIETADNEEARGLMLELRDEMEPAILEIEHLFQKEGAVVPIGFTKEDVHPDAPKLWDNGFDITFLRVLKEMSLGMHILHLTLSYREDIMELYQKMSRTSERFYARFSEYLLEKGLYTRSTYVTMPTTTNILTDKNYLKGTNMLGKRRKLNTVEFSYLFHTFESNITGMHLLSGFIQTTEHKDIKKYFTQGKELSKEIVAKVSDIFLENDIQPPATPGGTLTNSMMTPFSDKLMLYCNYLLGGLALGVGGFSAGFVFRNDLQTQNFVFAKDILEYQRNGINLLMEKGLLEEPPSMDV